MLFRMGNFDVNDARAYVRAKIRTSIADSSGHALTGERSESLSIKQVI